MAGTGKCQKNNLSTHLRPDHPQLQPVWYQVKLIRRVGRKCSRWWRVERIPDLEELLERLVAGGVLRRGSVGQQDDLGQDGAVVNGGVRTLVAPDYVEDLLEYEEYKKLAGHQDLSSA